MREGDAVRPLFAQRTGSTPLFDPSSCDLVHEGLSAVLTRGTAASREGKKLSAETGAVGKTGTSGAVADAWFVGYTDSLVVCIWIGFPNESLPIFASGTGANLAFPLFERVVRSAPGDKPARVNWGK
jgi:membrane carboxypeptidase/penicillin-binding protein